VGVWSVISFGQIATLMLMVELSSKKRLVSAGEPAAEAFFPVSIMSEKRGELILCMSTYQKGQAFLRQCAGMGCRVLLLTLEKHRDGDWPYDILDEVVYMPQGLTLEQITNTVTYLARTRKFERLIALDEFDMETIAFLREHMRIPGMGRTTTTNFRDKLAMRFEAQRAGALVPEFTPVFNYDDVRAYMAAVPGPWVLKPRSEASAIGIRKIGEPDELWRTLDQLGDLQSFYLLERFVPGEIFHVDSITSERQVLFSAVSQYGKPPMEIMHEGGVFTTRVIDRNSTDARQLTTLNRQLMPAMGMVRGVTHAEYIRGTDGRYYFLEVAARVGGAFIAEVVEQATGVNLWAEWAKIEVDALRRIPYALPAAHEDHAGSVLCLATTAEPDTSMFDAPEIVYRLKKDHHAGLIVRSNDAERVRLLLEDYAARFAQQYLAVEPPPLKPTA
jgi:ATP-grasp domain